MEKPVPIGVGAYSPEVVELDLADLSPQPEWLCGILFELDTKVRTTSAASLPRSAVAETEPAPVKVRQSAFAFD